MTKFKKLFLVTFFALSMLSTSIFADQWEDFTLYNKTDYKLSSFTTNEGDGWSSNWFSQGTVVEPGDSITMKFNNAEGPCSVSFKIKAEDAEGELFYKADFCKATKIYVYNDKVTWSK